LTLNKFRAVSSVIGHVSNIPAALPLGGSLEEEIDFFVSLHLQLLGGLRGAPG
jgi:hypothetical protein